MTTTRAQFGTRGEDIATAFFVDRGFRIVSRNWGCRLGEIDLVVERDDIWHFIEVKTRRSMTYGYPEEAITPHKLRCLARAIELYIQSSPEQIVNYQVDALAIIAIPDRPMEIVYVECIL